MEFVCLFVCVVVTRALPLRLVCIQTEQPDCTAPAQKSEFSYTSSLHKTAPPYGSSKYAICCDAYLTRSDPKWTHGLLM